MRRSMRCRALFALVLAWPMGGGASDRGSVTTLAGLPFVRVPSASYEPYGSKSDAGKITVAAFLLMTRPVTNEEFLGFIRTHPAHRRDRIARVFADEHYLSHWANPLELGTGARPRQPVTRVSWFAAKAFCDSHGLRLPTEAEWELAAAASAKQPDARTDPVFRQRLLDWYSAPSAVLPDVPSGAPNFYGARDLHGVIWEWVLDFSSAPMIGDSRSRGDSMRGLFCGGPAAAGGDNLDYATFMRLAMRSSLRADYTTANLGFRCAADATTDEDPKP